MVKAYEGKLSEYVIPVEELGFDPLVPNNIDWIYDLLNIKFWSVNFGYKKRSIHEVFFKWIISTFGHSPWISTVLIDKCKRFYLLSLFLTSTFIHLL